jgi:hypothetical protein
MERRGAGGGVSEFGDGGGDEEGVWVCVLVPLVGG